MKSKTAKKKCSTCKKNKSLSSFQKDKWRKDGLRSYCRLCKKKEDARRMKLVYSLHPSKLWDSKKKKKCSECGRTLTLTKKNWNRSRSHKGGLTKMCSACFSLVLAYGINYKDKTDLYEFQEKSCALCGRPHDIKWLNVDHDHKVYLKKKQPKASREVRFSSVRGLLCSPCNKSLGWYEIVDPSFRDKWTLVDRYLENPPAKKIWKNI